MKICIHAGHNPDGAVACGAVGFMKESTAAREIKDRLIAILAGYDLDVTDATCNNGTSQQDVLKKINAVQNSQDFDLCISIHLNAASSNAANGAEAYLYSSEKLNEKHGKFAGAFVDEMESIGYNNRGVKFNGSLAVLNGTKNPAVLLECGFVTSEGDTKLYNAQNIANAIADVVCKVYNINKNNPDSAPANTEKLYRVQLGAFKDRSNAEKLLVRLKALNFDAFIREE